MKILRRFARGVSGLFGRKQAGLDPSKLVGLYLAQANSREGAASEFGLSRQRRNGKFQTNRERA